QTSVLGESADSRWIEVDLSEQKLRAWDGSELFLETLVSTGLPWSPTPTGEFRIWIKLRATKMEGGSGKYYYYLPNVPYVMYFNKGYGLHGTYWHNDFGKPHSHGCVNLPTPVAERLYYWVGPVLSDGKGSTRSSPENPGTKVVVHE
ncbi:MAG: L,D-transpeptidase, partial [Patescibacteria group bacterium]